MKPIKSDYNWILTYESMDPYIQFLGCCPNIWRLATVAKEMKEEFYILLVCIHCH